MTETDYRHQRHPDGLYFCPVSGELTRWTFVDHTRGPWGDCGNSCQHCHGDKRPPASRLHDIERLRAAK